MVLTCFQRQEREYFININIQLYLGVYLFLYRIIMASNNKVHPLACSTLVVSDPSDCYKPVVTSSLSSDITEKEGQWKNALKNMLHEIQCYGDVKPQYKIGTPRRFWNVLSTAVCCTTVCGTCLMWDCVCCTVSLCCLKKNPFKWGCAFHGISQACDDTFADKRKDLLKNIKPRHISCTAMMEVCNEYLAAFDTYVSEKNAKSAKKANIIREQLFDILRVYTPNFRYISLHDNGNIDLIRQIVTDLPNVYKNVQLGFL